MRGRGRLKRSLRGHRVLPGVARAQASLSLLWPRRLRIPVLGAVPSLSSWRAGPRPTASGFSPIGLEDLAFALEPRTEAWRAGREEQRMEAARDGAATPTRTATPLVLCCEAKR